MPVFKKIVSLVVVSMFCVISSGHALNEFKSQVLPQVSNRSFSTDAGKMELKILTKDHASYFVESYKDPDWLKDNGLGLTKDLDGIEKIFSDKETLTHEQQNPTTASTTRISLAILLNNATDSADVIGKIELIETPVEKLTGLNSADLEKMRQIGAIRRIGTAEFFLQTDILIRKEYAAKETDIVTNLWKYLRSIKLTPYGGICHTIHPSLTTKISALVAAGAEKVVESLPMYRKNNPANLRDLYFIKALVDDTNDTGSGSSSSSSSSSTSEGK